ncbi:hypothetical protein [Bacillus marasmi]|uniref:hypothetical protein n=1 Tax=Bacillus marasmi TaxID=1926279 RepID=UPI001FEAB5EE|nr:hypothetical protein [Bacillus marasmi]
MRFTYNTTMQLHPVHIREDKKNYIVEDAVTGEFFEMPDVCIHAIEMIETGASLLEIETELKAIYPHEEINMIEFAEQLLEMELVQEINGQPITKTESIPEKQGFLWIPEKFAHIFFNRFMLVGYILFFCLNIIFLLTNPTFVPHYQDLFVFDVMIFNILLYMGLSFLLILFHELGHILAIRAVGQPTKLEIGHRLFLVVLETDMSSVWRLPRKQRNILYLAGLCFDNLVLFIALSSMLIFPNLSAVSIGIIGVIVFDVLIRIVYQCCVYLKTDLYYVLENSSGCYNLIENAQTYFKGLIFPKQGKSTNEMFQGEKKIVITYGIFYLLGMAITLSLLVFYIVPQLGYVFKETIHCISHPVGSMHFWDGILTILQLSLGLGLLLYSWIKKYKFIFKWSSH